MNTLLLLSALLGPPVGNPTSTPSVSQWCPGGTCIGNLTLPATGALKWSGRASVWSTADGKLQLSNAAHTGGVVLDFSVDGLLQCRNHADNAWCTFYSGAATISGNLTLSATSPFMYAPARASDLTTVPLSVMAGNAYWAATSAAKQAGGNLTLRGGLGSWYTTVTDKANSAGDTIAFAVTVGTTTTTTTLTAGTEFACAAAASNAECACNLYARLVSNPISGITPARTDATCSDAKVGFTPTVASVVGFTATIADAGGGGAFGAVTSGASGQVLIGDGAVSAPGLSFIGDIDTGIMRVAANNMKFVAGGAYVGGFESSGLVVNNQLERQVGSKGAKIDETYKAESVTFQGGAGDASKATTDLVDAGEIVRGIVGRVTTAGTTCTSFDVGINMGGGLDADNVANDISPAAGTTFTMSTAAAQGALGNCYAAGCEVTVTGNGGNCVSMVVAITAFKDQLTAPTSN